MIKAIKRIIRLLRPKVTVQTYQRKDATDHRAKVRDMANRLDIENGRKPKFEVK